MRIPFFISILCVISLLSGCGDKTIVTAKDLPKVKVYQVGDSISDDRRMFFPAIAHASDRSQLSFRVSGEVSKLDVRDGDRVTKGQVLAELDPTDYKLAVDNASASYSVANSQYKRSEQLVKKGLLAQSQFDELAAQRMIAKAELDLARLRLSFTKLTAPFDGIISRVNVDQFENIQVGEQVVNIHNPEVVDIVLQVSDKLFSGSPSNFDYQKVKVDIRLNNGNAYRAKLKEYTTEQDSESATYTVTFTMPVPQNEVILDGMAVDVAPVRETIGYFDTVPLITIPLEAVFNPDGDDLDRVNKYVWVVKSDNTVSKIRVETRTVTYQNVQIVDGVSQGDKIVVAGIARLRDGIKVDLVEDMPAGRE